MPNIIFFMSRRNATFWSKARVGETGVGEQGPIHWENSGQCFAASVKPFIPHGRASSNYFGEHHSWHIYKQIWQLLVGEIQPWQVRCLKYASVLGHVPQSFCGCFDTSSGMERPSLVKLPIKDSLVKLLPTTSSLRSSYYLTRFAWSSFIKHIRLTRNG